MKSFLELSPDLWLAHNAHAFAIRDAHPVTVGHTLVISRELVATWFEASREQQLAVLDLIDEVKRQLDTELSPTGFNVGFNAGASAGQTIPHLHVHVIPRYDGDHDDPRGGVRNVIAERGNYERVAADWANPPGPRASRLVENRRGHELLGALGPLFEQAEQVIIIASFVKRSGVYELDATFRRFLQRGGWLRIVTGDYLNITQADALRFLLDLQMRSAALREQHDESRAGRFELRVVKHADLGHAFHPKAYLFRWGPGPDGVAYVGSSNLSRSALTDGVEWNLRIERRYDGVGWDEVYRSAEALWERASTIDDAWLKEYRARARDDGFALPPGEIDEDDDEDGGDEDAAPEPRETQVEALAALADSRAAGHQRALVVMATGLGKTFLAAFDIQQFAQGRPIRVLVVAHRQELLRQAHRSLRRVLPDAKFSWCVGASSDLGGEVVLASIQKLARMDSIGLAREHFDYVVVDEVHHAAAPSYRKLLDYLRPQFMLGLTATPERADEGDVAGLFNDNIPYRADLGRGISTGHLVPFAYEGLTDPVDYAPIPWRSGRFDVDALAAAVQTQARMQTLWDAWERLPGTRSLVFCVSIAHARFVTDWLADKGVAVLCVHSGPGSADRSAALRKLEAGEIDVITTVDLFNEGIDCKPIDRVVMLRPTASPVVFLQQLGRGLRIARGKTKLQVLDFVGNHHAFLNRLRVLLSFAEAGPGVAQFIRDKAAVSLELPPGCSVEIELGAIELLAKLLPTSATNELVRVYRELRVSRGVRPSAGELFRRGLNPASVRTGGGASTWLEFVDAEGDLDVTEHALVHAGGRSGERVRTWFGEIERSMSARSFEMVVLDVLLDTNTLAEGMALDELAERCRAQLLGSPALLAGIEDADALETDRAAWLDYWNHNAIAALTKAGRAKGPRWFRVDDDRLSSQVPVPEDDTSRASFLAMTRELVDWQLARYRKRLGDQAKLSAAGEVASFRMKVLRNPSGNPILLFSNQPLDRDSLPREETDVRLQDGSIWQFRMKQIACNVARPVGSARNALPDLLRQWFGPDAGKPGTDFRVEFRRAPEGWWVEPLGTNVVALTRRDHVVAYPSLRAAAGAVQAGIAAQGEDVEATELRLPLPASSSSSGSFAVRACGDSMAGGREPIHDGDWVVFEWARQRGLGGVVGRIALVAVGDPHADRQFLIKRVVQTDAGVVLRSENPAHADIAANSETEVMAVEIAVVRPEQLAPAPGTEIADGQIGAAFGLSESPSPPDARVDGHLFVVVEAPGHVLGGDRVRAPVRGRQPGETAYVLTRAAAGWRYAGVGRWVEQDGLWAIPPVDFATSKALGDGRVSRRLEPQWLEAAREFGVGLAVGEWIEARGKRCRIVRVRTSGGVRIDGGPDGFAARDVSASDLGWVLCAREVAAKTGAVVDEAWVNRLRYLDGTPKRSTRWIDTGWALVLTEPGDELAS